MLYLAVGLFILAVIVVFVDVYIEGFGVLGAIGIAAVVASLVISAAFVNGGFIVILAKIAVMVPGTFLFFRLLKRRQLSGHLVLTDTLAEDVEDISGLDYFMGKEGTTKTALRPHGQAEFNGVVVDVRSESGYILANNRVRVVGLKDKRIIVIAAPAANAAPSPSRAALNDTLATLIRKSK